MPIVLFRVDERLIHGQVVVGWGEHVHMDRVMVVDDEIRASSWEQELYCLGVPPGVDADFLSVEEARTAIEGWSEAPRRIVVLVRDVATLERLAEGGLLAGTEVNLGGIHHAPGRRQVLPYVFLSPEEAGALRRVAAGDVRIAARDLPSTRPVPLPSLLEKMSDVA